MARPASQARESITFRLSFFASQNGQRIGRKSYRNPRENAKIAGQARTGDAIAGFTWVGTGKPRGAPHVHAIVSTQVVIHAEFLLQRRGEGRGKATVNTDFRRWKKEHLS